MDFFHWRKHYYWLWTCILAGSNSLKLKCLNDRFVSYTQLFSSQDINWWIGFTCDVFISCLGSHSDGTHSLQRIHWWASDAMLNFSKSVQMKEQLTYIFDGLVVSTFSANSIFFWVNDSFKLHLNPQSNPFLFIHYIVAFSNLLKSRVNQELFKIMAILFFTMEMENGGLCCMYCSRSPGFQ